MLVESYFQVESLSQAESHHYLGVQEDWVKLQIPVEHRDPKDHQSPMEVSLQYCF